ncbi:hypothetical protein Val02_69270 [Virgisporangium aliadipatigenens]|uniref:Uncharacterized protein n=1 Tax=Virgisporangium aliadipatigenens TaxID=741659 RepID=A0A8J3YRC7_9ACTN|nr:hypothetical protein [Virgisporangium aliadipatigenens]GIJ50041.1 hypothetical protein Val02_69270 [Virgisporangium aliadipatigenens]
MNDNPTAVGATISAATKAVLLALIATGVLPWTDLQVAAVALAITAVVDLAVTFGLIRPRVTPVSDPHDNDGRSLISITSL